MKKKIKVKRMFTLDGGSFLYPTGMMKYRSDADKLQRIIVPFFAFDTEDGWMLYDTGWSPRNLPLLEGLRWEPRIS